MWYSAVTSVRSVDAAIQEEVQCRLLGCIFGPPFGPLPSLDPSCAAWHDGTVRRLAEAIYTEGAFHQLPVLGDALEEAGCQDEIILRHCRQPLAHVRGCWIVDGLLGKE